MRGNSPSTGPAAVERIAEATGTPWATVDRVARVLKQHQPALWPRSGQGGGKRSTHVMPDHLVNLTLALAAADPITAAVEVVARYRSLVEDGGTLADRLETLIATLAHEHGSIPEGREAYRKTWCCTLFVGSKASASIFRPAAEEGAVHHSGFSAPIEQRDLPLDAPLAPAMASFSRQVSIPFAFMEVLGELFADSRCSTHNSRRTA